MSTALLNDQVAVDEDTDGAPEFLSISSDDRHGASYRRAGWLARFRQSTDRFFGAIGKFAVLHPWIMIVIPVCIGLSLCFGVLKINFNTDTLYLFLPDGAYSDFGVPLQQFLTFFE